MASHETPNRDAIILWQPKDIIYNIFFRLPVKTLLRLKSVCKSWLSLISSPEFIKTHLLVSANDPHFTYHGLIIGDWTNEGWLDIWTYSVYSLLHEPITETLRYNDHHIHGVIGYCNGLILVEDWFEGDHLHLWNPSTKELKTLPELDWISSFSITVYGFCYDELNDDFKVFAISPAQPYYEGEPCTYYEYKVSVYSLRCNCWRIIGDFPFRLICETNEGEPDFDNGYFANGSIYWLITPELQKKIILAFDIKSETYREVVQPNFGGGVYSLDLDTFGKSLSMLCQYEETRADLWIMKECGVEVSWTKLFTIPYMDQLITRYSNLKPICISRNGDIMLSLNSTMVLYNQKEKKIKHLLADHQFKHLLVYAYVESLISPHL